MTAVSDETGRDWLPLKYEDGPDFCTVTFATGAAFALTVHPERMKLMEAALSASPVGDDVPALKERIRLLEWAIAAKDKQILQFSDALSAAPVAQEPVAYQYRACIAGKWGDWTDLHQSVEGFRNGPWKFGLENGTCELRALYAGIPPATPAGLGADEIARVFARWKNSKNLHESLAAQNIEKELLALLSRAGDQSNSTHEEQSTQSI